MNIMVIEWCFRAGVFVMVSAEAFVGIDGIGTTKVEARSDARTNAPEGVSWYPAQPP